MKSLVPRIVISSLALALALSAGCGLFGPRAYSCQARCFDGGADLIYTGNTVSITADSAEDAESQCSADSFPDGPGCPVGSSFFECTCQ